MATIDPTAYFESLLITESTAGGSIEGVAASAPHLVIALSDIPELENVEEENGDIRRIIFAFESALYDAYQAIDAVDRPSKWISQRATTLNDSTNVITRTFIHQFNTETTGEEVADEPAEP